MLNKNQETFKSCIGIIVTIIVMLLSGLAFAEDVPEGQECCACAQDEAAFEQMLTEACQNGYNEQGIENPTAEQMNACITRTKAQILENCPEQTTRAVEGDRDGDGVPDQEDNCPNVPNPHQMRTDPNVQVGGRCRFIDNSDGTITDSQSGLDWLQDAYSGGRMTWDEANEYCDRLWVAGGGWWLPEKSTLQELLPLPQGHPFIGDAYGEYWSSTEGTFWPAIPHIFACNGSTGECEERFSGGFLAGEFYAWPVRNTTAN
jgi:hypothetical protein